MITRIPLFAALLTLSATALAQPRDYVTVVGSSTGRVAWRTRPAHPTPAEPVSRPADC